MKEINCAFQMGGTYYLKERSVLAARRRAMTDLPLPEDREYINDSLVVDDLDECMAANGWSDEEVAYLSKLESSTLINMIGQRIKEGVEIAPNEPFTTARLKMFLLDYFDIEYTPAQQNTPQPSQAQPNTTRPCFIVLYSCNKKDRISAHLNPRQPPKRASVRMSDPLTESWQSWDTNQKFRFWEMVTLTYTFLAQVFTITGS